MKFQLEKSLTRRKREEARLARFFVIIPQESEKREEVDRGQKKRSALSVQNRSAGAEEANVGKGKGEKDQATFFTGTASKEGEKVGGGKRSVGVKRRVKCGEEKGNITLW